MLLLAWRFQVLERLVWVGACLPLIVIVKSLCIDEHGNNDVAHTALEQVRKRDTVGRGGFCHVPQFVLEIVDLVLGGLNLRL